MAGGNVFNKYFPDDAAHNVQSVNNNIIGDDKTSGDQTGGDNTQSPNPCSDELSRITIKPDFVNPDTEEKGCISSNTMAETREGSDQSEDDPTIIFCPAGLAHRGIKKGYDVGQISPGPQAVNCEFIGDRVTWKMETLGSVLLHEYT